MRKITFLFILLTSFTYGQVLSEDFESGLSLPIGWMNNDIAGGGEIWSFANTGEAIGYNPPNTIYYTDGLLVGNYAVFDSDGYGGSIAENAALESPSFNCSSLTNIQLSYNHFFTAGYSGEGFVEVYDGTTWIQVAYYTGADQAESSLGLVEIDVTNHLTGVTNAKVRFRWVGDYSWGWAVDNIVVQEGPACIDPDITFDDFTTTTVDISLDITGDFDLEWGVYPYTQGSGGSTATITNGNSYQMTGLTPGVSYNLFVRQDCGLDGTSEYVEAVVGTSPDLTTLPLTEDFEPDANQALVLNFGLSFNNVTGDWNFAQDDLTDGDFTNDYANSGVSFMFSNSTFIDADSDATFFIGPFDLTTSNDYTFTFMQRNIAVSSATRPNKDIELVVATTTDGTTNTVIATFDDMNNITYTQRMATFTPTTNGSYYFGVRDKSTFLASATVANVVIIDDLSITSQLSIDDFEANTFKHFYNANTDNLTLTSSNLAIEKIELYTVLGQQVMTKLTSSTNEVVNLSNLNDGLYLVNIESQGKTKTFKILKH